jgi:AcrR family transcriptional regulator
MNKKPVKERLIEAAEKLFYLQGYRATGINQIIKESETAKASFYQHFPSKEALCVAYLEHRHIISHERQKDLLLDGENPIEKVCNLFENIRQNALSNDFNGCPFLNIASEINEHDNDIRKCVTKHKSKLIKAIEETLAGYKEKKQLAEMAYVIYEGANISVKNYRDMWPIEVGTQAVRTLLEGAQHE